jgi:AcrR family transcriptional regulator
VSRGFGYHGPVDAELGLRERKKLRTRQLIAEAARRLFSERGFEAVSVAEIAREAEVSEATVFNYFPTKEDLVYHGMEAFESELLDAIRFRPVGESVLDAFGRFVIQPRGFLAAQDPAAEEALVAASRMIAASPALLARERQILARYTEAVAALLRAETGAGPTDLRAWVAAATLVGLHGALIDYVRRRLLEGPPDVRRLARELRREGQKAIDLLRGGLGDYALRQATQ